MGQLTDIRGRVGRIVKPEPRHWDLPAHAPARDESLPTVARLDSLPALAVFAPSGAYWTYTYVDGGSTSYVGMVVAAAFGVFLVAMGGPAIAQRFRELRVLPRIEAGTVRSPIEAFSETLGVAALGQAYLIYSARFDGGSPTEPWLALSLAVLCWLCAFKAAALAVALAGHPAGDRVVKFDGSLYQLDDDR